MSVGAEDDVLAKYIGMNRRSVSLAQMMMG
jgi:hypothetical protein